MEIYKMLVRAIFLRWKNVLHKPLCNLRRDRAPVLWGVCFPLCWRCTGIITGLLLCWRLRVTDATALGRIFFVGLVVPCCVDALLQFIGLESTNGRRALLGFLAGIGLAGIF
jgi:uncharacterized membrane protein